MKGKGAAEPHGPCNALGVCDHCATWAETVTTLRAKLAAAEREVFDYQQREKAWNESEALADALKWFREAKKAHEALAAAEAEIAALRAPGGA